MSDYFAGEGADVWVPVPVVFGEEEWASGREWAEWFAEAATRGREDADSLRDSVLEQALLISGYPAEGLAGRYWHYPVDGVPSGFVDVRVASRGAGEGEASRLLPDAGETALMPVEQTLDVPPFSSAVRRLTLRDVTVGSDDGTGAAPGEDRPGTLAFGEWLGVTADAVCYLTSFDTDVESLTHRLEDTQRLFAAFGDVLVAEAV